MRILRTPEERFANLRDFPFEPNYIQTELGRVHYVDEGWGQVVLCLHGEPTWSYLYRKMIPILAGRHRCVAMDFIGFGRSDKFAEREAYSLDMHCDALRSFIERLSLNQITLVVHDWGGLIGLRVASEMPELFARLVIMNTFLPTGEEPPSEGFLRWKAYAMRTPDLPAGQIVKRSALNPELITDEIVAAYDAPFPDVSYKAAAQMFPLLVPIEPDQPGAEQMRQTRAWLSKWDKPTLVIFSDSDQVTAGLDRFFRRLIPAASREPEITPHAGHFLQEERGQEIAEHILSFIERNPLD
jgi:haloalkane dehalogenase